MKTETCTCQHCGVEWVRPLARGQRPKWCSQRCADLGKKAKRRVCERCGIDYIGLGGKFCSRSCAASAGNVKRRRTAPQQLTLPFDQRSDIRRGYEDGDTRLLLEAVRRDCRVDETGCWVWQRRTKKGYPALRFSGREVLLHRIVTEAAHGAPLGTQAAHHVCANSRCLNPGHLQPVTHRENVAEMLARHSYLNRIAELEAALRETAPNHPALVPLAVA